MSGAGNLLVPQVYTSFDDDNVLLTSVNESTFKVTPAREGSSRRSRDTHKTTPLSSSRDIIRTREPSRSPVHKPVSWWQAVPVLQAYFGNAEESSQIPEPEEYIIPSIHQAITKIGSIARLCHPATAQIVDTYKSKKGRCGYVNAQMMLSALMVICPEKFVDSELLGIPSITEIQNLVEKSWDNGFDVAGAATFQNNLLGTDEWIGATEIYSLISNMGVKCQIYDFADPRKSFQDLIDWAFRYFACPTSFDAVKAGPLQNSDTVITTEKPPVYLQYQGHSLTLIGVELTGKNEKNLLVFDPRPGMVNVLSETKPWIYVKQFRADSSLLRRQRQYQALVALPGDEVEESDKIIRGIRC